jgi:hypothetical protein
LACEMAFYNSSKKLTDEKGRNKNLKVWNQICVRFVNSFKMGLTGFDSRCKDWARMQAGVCTALKDSYEP